MGLRVAVQMDPLEGINIAEDTTFALMLEGQKRSHSFFHYLPSALSLWEGERVVARGRDVVLYDKVGSHFSAGELRQQDLGEVDAILLRQDPPFDMSYITTTYILEWLSPGILVINEPVHVRNAPEKLFVRTFSDLMPATLITRDPESVRDFRLKHNDIVLKPLYGNGGRGVFRVKPDDKNIAAFLELFCDVFKDAFVVQEYLPAVLEGDKRIILIDGVFAGMMNRVPSSSDIRSNMHAGGRAEAAVPSARDFEICDRLGPFLKEQGLILVGIDVIGDYLTEVNVTSPGGIREILNCGGPDISSLFWDVIELRLQSVR
ncbi:MAG: glutathione synthase [Alphaproteobacteria bacterium]|nr:glutathione synthase [Alphaproteobacteria bacterium]